MTSATIDTAIEPLAVHGGPKAVPSVTGVGEPKIGIDEFLAIARRFGFSPQAIARLTASLSNEDLPESGPTLSRYLTTFPKPSAAEEYEALVREKFGVPHAYAISSGTAALHSAFVGVGVGPGTEVIVPAVGFIATGMAVTLAGGIPVYGDVDESFQLDPRKLDAVITPRTVAIAPTHVMGAICDMDAMMAVARRHNLKVVEDCAQAPGGKYRGKYVGTIGDVGCFSISAYKIIGGGESGMVVTSDARIYDRVRQCAEAGGLWRPSRFAPPSYDGELFLGTNYRISEMESAINVVQFGKVDRVCGEFRRVNRRILKQLLPCREIRPQTINDKDGHIGYTLRFIPETHELGAAIAHALHGEGISASHYGAEHGPDFHLARDMFPINLKAGHTPGGSVFDDPRNAESRDRGGYKPGQCPVSEDLFGREVSTWLRSSCSDEDCDNIARGINKVLTAYCTPDASAKPWI